MAYLRRLVCFTGMQVVEMGCGDGRLTVGYAAQASEVIALDPDAARIAAARANPAFENLSQVTFRAADARSTGIPDEWADIVLFTRSL